MTGGGPEHDATRGHASTTRRRIAYLTYGSGEYDARTVRLARSAVEAGDEVTVYARWEPGLPLQEQRDGYRLVRAPWGWLQAIPGLTGLAVRRELRRRPRDVRHERLGDVEPRRGGPLRSIWRAVRLIGKYPLRPLGWARALERVAEPADIWHGSWAGSLPALVALRRKFGGHAVYDSRDVYLESRVMATGPRLLRGLIGALERRWARAVDLVITVNRPYAELLAKRFGIEPPAIVMNCPEPWTPSADAPDLIREALRLPPGTRIVLYQGQLITDRGIEQAMEAILAVPDAALVLLGYGKLEPSLRGVAAREPYLGRAFVLPAVPPDDLLDWTASADVLVMPIQPTSLNHRYTTPQKLFEAIAVGVPVVASDLPGMADIVNDVGAGGLCDPRSPASIAGALRSVLDLDPGAAAERRARILASAHDRYNWRGQVEVLRGLYDRLLEPSLLGSRR